MIILQEDKVAKIQAFMKSRWAQKDFTSLSTLHFLLNLLSIPAFSYLNLVSSCSAWRGAASERRSQVRAPPRHERRRLRGGDRCEHNPHHNISFAVETPQHCFRLNATEIQKMKQEVVKEIRANGQLESDLSEMDIKIGLLVKNRITLQVR